MWSLIIFLGICSTHWTTGTGLTNIIRGNYLVGIAREETGNKLAKLTPINLNLEYDLTLDLSGLNLTSIERHIFVNLTKLTSLNLSENEFSEIPEGVFSDLHNLEKLFLANNTIETSDTTSFFGLNNLKLLDLSNSDLFNGIERSHLRNLPKSAEILLEGISNLNLISRSENASYTMGPWRMHGYDLGYELIKEAAKARKRIPLESTLKKLKSHPFYVKVCLIEDGLLESVSIAPKDESSGNCSKIDPGFRTRELILRNLTIKQLKSGWYKIPDKYFSLINLSDNNITEITAEVLNDLPSGISMVKLDHNKIRVIKNGVIENRFLKVLTLKSNLISSIEDGAFEKTNLESLDVTSNFLTNLNFTRTLPTNITELFVGKNEISEIFENSFANLKALKYLIMSKNRITHLPANALRNLKELREIDLKNNALETIDLGTFSDNGKIVKLLLSHNHFREVPAGLFNNLKIVQEIALDGNRIKKISRDTLSGIENLIIYRLKLNKNEIDTIEEGSFANKSIEILDLAENKLSEKSIAKRAFESFETQFFKLNNNLFTTIAVEAFSEINPCGILNLANNQIKTINPGDAKYMTHINSLALDGNGINHLVNGALYGFPKDQTIFASFDENFHSIQVGVFDDANSTHVNQ